MMKLYVVYDRLAQECGPVFESKNDDTAVRAFRHHLNEVPASRQDEYKLVHVGTISSESMVVTVEDDCPREVVIQADLREVLNG